MKRIFAVIMTMALLTALTIPACAWGGGSFPIWDWWRSWQPAVEEPAPEEPAPEEPDALPAPEITKATYCHKNAAYSGFDNHLQILWDAVDGADSYEVEITKADGTVDTYTTSGPCLYEKTDCPKVYVADTSTWESATVRVRAVAGEDSGDWSDAEKISCNAFHH